MLGAKWWKDIRYDAYEANNRHCWACARRRNRLEAHECYEIDYEQGIAEFTDVVALCSTCHHFIHSNRLVRMVQIGVYDVGIFNAVRGHGYHVLRQADLMPSPWARLNFEPDYILPDALRLAPFAAWNEWRMVIFGEEHYSKFADRAAHDAHYDQENLKALKRKNDDDTT